MTGVPRWAWTRPRARRVLPLRRSSHSPHSFPKSPESYDWEAVVVGLSGGSDPYSGIDTWHSSGGLHMWHPNQPQPETAWEAQIDGYYIRGSRELDHQKRMDYYHRAQEIIAENVPLIYTTLSERLTATRNVFGNTTPTPYGLWDIRYLYRTDWQADRTTVGEP